MKKKGAKRRAIPNHMIVEKLSEATIAAGKRADFSDLVGKWTPDTAFDEILASVRQIDRNQWK